MITWRRQILAVKIHAIFDQTSWQNPQPPAKFEVDKRKLELNFPKTKKLPQWPKI